LLGRVKPQTAAVRLKALRYAAGRRAAMAGDESLQIAAWIEPARGDPPAKRRALTDNEVGRLLDACRGPRPADLRDLAVVTLLATTGMRRSSLAGIRLQDFGVDEKRGHTFVAVTLKGGKKHAVPLGRAASEAVQPWVAWLRSLGISDGPIFRSLRPSVAAAGWSTGKQALSTDAIWRVVDGRARLAGLGHQFPHILRHSLVTNMRARGVRVGVIGAITGHRVDAAGHSAIIEGTYTDSAAFAGAAIAAMDGLFK
jgi:integrase